MHRASGPVAKAEVSTAVTLAGKERLLTDLLRGISRTFYLTLRVLPAELREPVSLAYLLARAADTIADTRLLPPRERLNHLLAFRAQVEGATTAEALQEIGLDLADKQSIPAERALLASLPEAFSMLEALREPDRSLVRSVVVTLTRGMEFDLTTFPAEDSGRVAAIKDASELDRYTYYVAGCVGEFWTAITIAHMAPLRGWDARRMSEKGVRFGKALQLTNVLRDVPRDLRIGRCYLPQSELTTVGLMPEDLLAQSKVCEGGRAGKGWSDTSAGVRARPVLLANMKIALDHYHAAEEYLLAMPVRYVRLRLAVLWPILIGLGTLAELAGNEAWLDAARPSKVTRAWVYRTLALSLPCVFWNGLLRAWIARLRKRVEKSVLQSFVWD